MSKELDEKVNEAIKKADMYSTSDDYSKIIAVAYYAGKAAGVTRAESAHNKICDEIKKLAMNSRYHVMAEKVIGNTEIPVFHFSQMISSLHRLDTTSITGKETKIKDVIGASFEHMFLNESFSELDELIIHAWNMGYYDGNKEIAVIHNNMIIIMKFRATQVKYKKAMLSIIGEDALLFPTYLG